MLFLAQLVYVVLGFGAGMIAVGGLALILPDVQDAVVLLLLVNLPSELAVVMADRRRVRWRQLTVLLAGIAVGLPVGAGLLRWGEPIILLAGLGVFLVVVGVLFLVAPPRPRPRLPGWVTPPVGLLSGLLTGLFGTGGPPLIVYYGLKGTAKREFRSSLMALFLVMTAVRVPSYAVVGLITWPRLVSGLLVLPAAVLGAAVGQRIHLELEEATFKRVVSVALVLIGVLLLTGPGSR